MCDFGFFRVAEASSFGFSVLQAWAVSYPCPAAYIYRPTRLDFVVTDLCKKNDTYWPAGTAQNRLPPLPYYYGRVFFL
jgi:hypothetical protein